MKTLASMLVLAAGLTALPALAGSMSTTDQPVVLAGGQFCVGPACIGRDRDRDDSEAVPFQGYAGEQVGNSRLKELSVG